MLSFKHDETDLREQPDDARNYLRKQGIRLLKEDKIQIVVAQIMTSNRKFILKLFSEIRTV